MAGQDDLIRIVLDVIGEEKVKQAEAAIEQEKDAILQLAAALKAGSIAQAQFDAAALQSAAVIQRQQQVIRQNGRGFNSQALLEFSRAAEDAQYGIAGVLNNIPGLIQSLGGGPGITGIISVAAVAVTQLAKNWESLASVFGASATETEADRMEKLRQKTKLTADEAERLAKADRFTNAGKSFSEDNRTEAERNADEATQKAIREADPKQVALGLLKNAPDLVDRSGSVPVALKEVEQRKSDLEFARSNAGNSEDINAIENAEKNLLESNLKLASARDQSARDLTTSATLDKDYNGARKRLIAAIESNPQAFGPKSGDLLASLKLIDKGEDPKAVAAKAAKELAEQIQFAEQRVREKVAEGEQGDRDNAEQVERERLFQEKIDNWKFAAQQQVQQENEAAGVQDILRSNAKRREDAKQKAEIISPGRALQDAVQQAFRGSDRERTAMESLTEQREATRLLRKISEQRLVAGPTRVN